jgi:hypothetical protein
MVKKLTENGTYEKHSKRFKLIRTDWDFYNEHGVKKSQYPYSEFFNDNTRKKIREHWNNKCVITGITNEEHKQLYNQELHIHHWNYNKDENDIYYMLPVCNSINLMANFNKESWESLFGGIAETGIPWYETIGGK